MTTTTDWSRGGVVRSTKRNRLYLRRSTEERLFDKVWQTGTDPVRSCWIWTGSTQYGYGRIAVPGTTKLAHRVSWEIFNGPIPDGLFLDHLCRNRACVNPCHLDPVTHLVNVRRGIRPVLPPRTHCEAGHPWVNPIIRPTGKRECRPCNTRRTREFRASRRAAA